MVKVISISGWAQHGKSTSAAMLKDALEVDGYKALIIHYADLLKHICQRYFGWNGEKDDAGRSLLQRIGTDVVRAQVPDYWVNFVADLLDLFPDEWDYVIIPDCRFPNEIEVWDKRGYPNIHIRIVRFNFESSLTPEQRMHPSEYALNETAPGIWLINDGTLDDLREKIEDLVVKFHGIHQLALEI